MFHSEKGARMSVYIIIEMLTASDLCSPDSVAKKRNPRFVFLWLHLTLKKSVGPLRYGFVSLLGLAQSKEPRAGHLWDVLILLTC